MSSAPISATADYLFATSDSVRIRVRHFGAHGGRPVILHHGFGGSSESEWLDRGVVALLVGAGRRVVTLDARGHGGSDHPHERAAYGEARVSRDLIELVAALGEPVDLIGYSMGAIATLLAAAAQTVPINRIVVGGIGSGVVEVGGLDSRVLDPQMLAAAFAADPDDPAVDPGLAAWRDQAASEGADVQALAAFASALLVDGVPLDQIDVPVLIVVGAVDILAHRPEVLAGALRDAQLIVVEGGDHNDTLTRVGVLDEIIDFLT